MPNPRIEKRLPRGRLGYLGIATGIGALISSVTVNTRLALLFCTLAAILSVWLAIGLRADYRAGEAVDELVFDEDQTLTEWVLGDTRTTVWRISSMVVVAALVAVAIVFARLLRERL